MSFNNRKYHFYLLFGDITKNQEPWTKKEWVTNIQPLLDKILKHSPYYDKTALGTVQYVPRPNSEFFNEVKFGRLGWNEKSIEKWTIKEHETIRRFEQLDSWTPMRTVCAKNDIAPDVYFSISNERHFHDTAKVKFDFFMVVAVAVELNFNPYEIIHELSQKIKSKKTVHLIRPWGGMRTSNYGWEFMNSIQDTSTFGIYKNGKTLNIHDIDFKDIEFEPYWETIYGS